MNTKQKTLLSLGFALIFLFVIWTVLLTFVDTAPIGPCGSSVGFAKFNAYFHELTGANMTLYTITDWLGIIPVLIAFSFAILGLVQLIKRKSLFKVEQSLLLLGCFYFSVIMVFMIFEKIVINYRPILINGVLEASYPSSTTLLFSTVMPTAITEFRARIKNAYIKNLVSLFIGFTALFGIVLRIISGVHWATDIIGGLLISSGFNLIYHALRDYLEKSYKKVDTDRAI